MATRLNPYINFIDNAREALEFYQSVFGGKVTINTFGEFGMADSPVANNVMHGSLEGPNGLAIMASDTPPEMEPSAGSQISMSLSGDDADDLRGYWEQLSEGGTVVVPFEKQMWGDVFGMCVDRFGINWMVDIAKPAE